MSMSNFGSYHGFVGSVSSTNTEARRGVGTFQKKKEKGKAILPLPPLLKKVAQNQPLPMDENLTPLSHSGGCLKMSFVASWQLLKERYWSDIHPYTYFIVREETGS